MSAQALHGPGPPGPGPGPPGPGPGPHGPGPSGTSGARAPARHRGRGLTTAAALLGALALASAGCGGSQSNTTTPTSSTTTTPGPGGLLAPTGNAPSGQPIDGIRCLSNEQLAFHIHAHVAVFVNGGARVIPAGIGIVAPLQVQNTAAGPFVGGGKCFYWLHSHTVDGVVHIESPIRRTFTLGDYFDVYGQPLSRDRVGPATGPVTAYLDAKPYPGDPRSIPLHAHAVIQLDVGQARAPMPFGFPPGL